MLRMMPCGMRELAGHNQQITNVTIKGGVGVGGTGVGELKGQGAINGALHFSASNRQDVPSHSNDPNGAAQAANEARGTQEKRQWN